MKQWYAIPCQKETGEYTVAEGITDFPRGVYLAYQCCLVTGLDSEDAAKECFEKYPCKRTLEKG